VAKLCQRFRRLSPSVFAPANLLREGRRQRRLADIAVPAVDL
jgi:hypothetical protein